MANSTMNIVIGGEAGQGLVTVGTLLSKALVRQGYRIVVVQDYQSRIRGGHNTFRVRASTQDILGPEEDIDLLVALTAETVELHRERLREGALVVVDQAFPKKQQEWLSVPYKDIASKLVENVAALGVIAALVGLKQDLLERMLAEIFKKKEQKVVDENIAALKKAYEWEAEQEHSFEKLAKPEGDEPRMMANGNQAIALGALAAGLKFCSFYPMTPSTSINLMVTAHAKEMGVVVEQAEDEIAAVNMAIGASYAGVPAMAATSGGGFALMVEGVSLAGMTETPVVIVVAQRPGPATGLPTRTEQADLAFVLRAGHGEFPRAVFAPGSVEECFHLTRTAFELAERYQGPMFILTDQFLADSYRAVKPFDIAGVEPVAVGADPASVKGTYERFAVSDDGVSPRLIPGASKHLVVVDSDEHTRDGHITEDLGVRVDMVDKRLKKGAGVMNDVVAPAYDGDGDPDILLVSWGSTAGAMREAADDLARKGTTVATLHFAQVWPLKPDTFMPHLEKAARAVMVEGNATAQLAALIRGETGFHFEECILRYDGLPITCEYILKGLEN